MKQDIRSFKGLKDRLVAWYNTINAKSGRTLVVTIARKGPRLYEYGSLLSGEATRLSVVSEHALPFIIGSDFDKEYSNIVLADEAIYHGTTFERIYSLLLTGLYLSGGNKNRKDIECIPAVISTESQVFEKYIKIKEEHCFKISKEEIPFYIDSLITGFQSLGKPYDIEFPLFYIQTGLSEEDNISLAEKMADTLKSHFGDNRIFSYKVDHWNREVEDNENNTGWSKHIQNVSIVLDNLLSTDKGIVKPEFWKIRIFVKKSRICIASFAPHIIPSDYVTEYSSLFEGSEELKELWSKIYSQMIFFHKDENIDYRQFITRKVEEKDTVKTEEHSLNYYWEQQKLEYQYHCKKTLIISANYLLSFYYLTKVSTLLCETVKNTGIPSFNFVTDLSDLQYLFGYKLSQILKEKLDSLIFSSFILKENIMPEINQYELIPISYKDDFDKENINQFLKNRSVSQLISSNFSNQHRLIELKSRNRHALYDRLRFGESFSSLYRKFLLFTSEKQIIFQLHQGLDQRIDDGSIVPNYVCNISLESSPFFRMFRSGENEDKQRDQLLRIVYHIAWRLTSYRGVSKVSESLLLFVFHLVFVNAVSVPAFRNLCGICFKAEFDIRGKLSILFVYGGNCAQDLLQYVIDSDVLSKVEDKSSSEIFFIVSSNDYTELLSQTSILDIETSTLIDCYVDMALLVKRKLHPYELRDLQQWYECRDKNTEYSAKLKKWWEQVTEIFDDCGQIINVEKVYRTFDTIFTIYPISDLTKVRANIVDICKLENREEWELQVLNQILPTHIPNNRLIRTVEGIYLIFILLMARENGEQKDIISYSMRKLLKNFGNQYEDINKWYEQDCDWEYEYRSDNFPCIMYDLLKTIITKYFAHDRVDGYIEKDTCRSTTTVSRTL